MNPILEQARRLYGLGFSVIPVPRPRPGVAKNTPGDGKTPVIKWGVYQTQRPTTQEIDAWFGGEPVNIAIITGAISGIVVIDCDSPEAVRVMTKRLVYTPWQVQTQRGFHLYYRHPGVRVTNKTSLATADVHVRGDGGYVITVGSVHATGVAYRLAGKWCAPREAVPLFWPGWITAPRRMETASPPRIIPLTGTVVDRARAYLSAIPRPEIGHGSDAATFYAAARLVCGFELSCAEAEELLWEWCGNRAGWTRDWVARKVENAEKYGTEPLGALR